MRTVLLAPALFASEGGIERMMRLYLQALTEIAAPAEEVVVAALNDSHRDNARLATYSPQRRPRLILGRRHRARFALGALTRMATAQRVVCGHLHLWPLTRLARRLNPRLRAYLVTHGVEAWRPWTHQQRRANHGAAGLIAVSAYTRQHVLERCPELAPTQVTVVPNALDPHLPRGAPGATRSGRIVTLSRLSSSDTYKGIDQLIRALPQIRAQVADAHLRIIGDGDDRARLTRLAQEVAPAHIAFTGALPDAAVQAELEAAQLFALPSRDEGFGLVYLEAFAHGKPCLAAQSGGAPEVVDDAGGVLVPFGDADALVAGAVTALRRSWDANRIRARAAAFSYSHFRDRLGRVLA